VKTYLTVYFGTVLVAMFLVPIVSRLAKWYRLVDAPGPRKVHKIPIPRIGGIVFVVSTLALVLPVFLLNNNIGQSFRESGKEFIALLVGAIFIFTVGLIDDLRSIRGYIKLLCLVAASLAICASGATLSSISFGKWFVLNTGLAAWPLTVLWIVIITVCMGVIDGLDGLAAGIAAIVCGTLVLMALWSGQAAMAVLMLALLGSVTGFLFFNFYPAKIFMGDCGSMFLGFLIGAGSIVFQTKTHTLVGLAIPFLVMGVPILDTGFVVIARRFLGRRSIFAPDRNHLHHRLMDLGLHHRTVVIIIYAVTVICASIGRRTFEMAQVRMRESTSFQEWWEAVCTMGKKMHFQTIGLWNCRSGQCIRTCMWNVPEDKFKTSKTAIFTLPIRGNGSAEWEIKAHTSVNGYLELSGQQAILLARLMDEFPLPEQEEETEELELFTYAKRLTSIQKNAEPSL